MAKSHTLLELSQSIERVIKRTFNTTYWVSAEISKLNHYPKSGHCYPELVEKLNGKIVAEIRSTIWKNTFQRLTHKFHIETGEELREGMKILFAVQVNYSPTHGISLNVTDIDPSFTLGEIAKEKKRTIETLQRNGLFDANRKTTFPFFPNRIAIISVSTSKGYQDYLETMANKTSHINYYQELFPAILQGDVAVNSITEQLDIIKQRSSEFDVVMIIRGGGGDVGLNCYNHIKMASAVASFPIPVITGIGHSTNVTVVEMVSHTNRITPTAVANTLVEIYTQLEIRLQNAIKTVQSRVPTKIAFEKQQLLNSIHYLKSSSSQPIHSENIRIQNIKSNLKSVSSKLIQAERSLLELDLTKRIQTLSDKRINHSKQKLELVETKLRILDPKNILKRGFSLTTSNGQVISKITNLKEGDRITTELFDGKIESEIKKMTHE